MYPDGRRCLVCRKLAYAVMHPPKLKEELDAKALRRLLEAHREGIARKELQVRFKLTTYMLTRKLKEAEENEKGETK